MKSGLTVGTITINILKQELLETLKLGVAAVIGTVSGWKSLFMFLCSASDPVQPQ